MQQFMMIIHKKETLSNGNMVCSPAALDGQQGKLDAAGLTVQIPLFPRIKHIRNGSL